MNTPTRWIVRAGAAALVGLFVVSDAVPVRAEDHDRGRREHERRDRHEWHPYYEGRPGYVVPPPAPVYAPPIAPSVNLVFPLRF